MVVFLTQHKFGSLNTIYMTIYQTFRLLFQEAILSEEQFKTLTEEEKTRPMSIHWEVRIFLLLGISFLCGGLGTLVYKNIDTIGHQAIIALIALALGVCGWFVWQKRQPFRMHEAQKEQPLADNILLLGCSLFLIFEGYLQYQYQIFGTRYGLATLIPALLFTVCAYRFDHIGVLTMALTAFTSWAGLAVTPLSIFQENAFNNEVTLMHTGIIVGMVFIGVGLLLNQSRIKPHFTFSYLSFGFNLVCMAALYGAFSVTKLPYCLLSLGMCALAILYARREHSYFFLLAGVVYGYIAFTTLISEMDWAFEVWSLYGVLSCFGIVFFFLNYKRFLEK
jgi:Predicted membrane protein (DUF2157)